MEHTHEPWVMGMTNEHGTFNPSIVYDTKGGAICSFYRMTINRELDLLDKYDAEGLANVQRTISCVNALAGVKDPAAYVEAAEELTRQRDALLKAAKDLAFSSIHYFDTAIIGKLDALRTAITACENTPTE